MKKKSQLSNLVYASIVQPIENHQHFNLFSILKLIAALSFKLQFKSTGRQRFDNN